MLVIVSDLHFRDNPGLTVPAAMTSGFLTKTLIPMVQDALVNTPRPRLEVLFLGDIFDINRAAYWTSGAAGDYRPWSDWKAKKGAAGGTSSSATAVDPVFERHIMNVMAEIAAANKQNLELLRDFRDTTSSLWTGFRIKPEICFSFVPGNHDRLVQYSANTRQELMTYLGLIGDAKEPFPWIYRNPAYSVLALHGHLFDSYNFGGGKHHFPDACATSPWYNYPPLGDAITVMFGQDMVQRFCKKANLTTHDQLALSLAIIDEVRPQSASLRWLQCWLRTMPRLSDKLRANLEESVIESINDILKEDFVKSWVKELLPWYQRAFLRILTAIGHPKNLEDAIGLFSRLAGKTRSSEEYANEIFNAISRPAFMQWWHSLEPVPRYLVVGHTHRPIIIPLAGRNAVEPQDESLYFNSGTWIGIVEQGRSTAEGFVQRDQVTHVTFYTDGEDVHGPERSQWEFWTGNLRRGPIGTAAPAEPEVKVIAALEPAGNERKSG